MDNFLKNLHEAEEIIKRIGHMVYVTYPIIQDKRLILKIILETKNALVKCINSILQYEHMYKHITLSKDPKENMKIFKLKCSPRYSISIAQMNRIFEIFDIAEKHMKSPFEFKKHEKIIILSEDSIPNVITIENSKEFLNLAKEILEKSKIQMGF